MDNMNRERHYAVQEQISKHICQLEELTKLKEKEDNIRREKLKEIERATFELHEAQRKKLKEIERATFELREAQRKHTSLTVKEKAVLENLRLCSSSLGNKKQKWRIDSDPPYLNERHITSSSPGFMFQPDDECILSLLKEKSSNPCQTSSSSPIKDCPNLYRLEPWHLPGAVGIKETKALYFYVQTKKKSEIGDRKGPNGFWKATGNKMLRTPSNSGYKRTLKYCKFPDDENDRSSKNAKPTNWIMHEYRLDGPNSQSQEGLSQHWTICKITSTEKNTEVPNDFSKEGSIDPSPMGKQPKEGSIDPSPMGKQPNSTSPMEVQPNSTSPAPKHLDNNDLAMEIEDEAHLQFGEWIQEQRGKLKKQRMNRETHQSDEATRTHEVETGGVEPQQFESPQTSASLGGWSLNPPFFSGREDDNQSRFVPSISEHTWEISELTVPSISEHTSASSVAGFPNQDFIEKKEDENQSRFDPFNLKQINFNSAAWDNW